MYIDTYNFTNNLRWCYAELFKAKKLSTIKEFADLCGIPENTMGRYLVSGTYPRDVRRIKQIEQKLGKEDGYMNVVRTEADFDAGKMCWKQPNQQGKPKHRYDNMETDARGAAEDGENVIARIAECDSEELRAFLREVRKEVRGHISRSDLKGCPKLYEIAYGY